MLRWFDSVLLLLQRCTSEKFLSLSSFHRAHETQQSKAPQYSNQNQDEKFHVGTNTIQTKKNRHQYCSFSLSWFSNITALIFIHRFADAMFVIIHSCEKTKRIHMDPYRLTSIYTRGIVRLKKTLFRCNVLRDTYTNLFVGKQTNEWFRGLFQWNRKRFKIHNRCSIRCTLLKKLGIYELSRGKEQDLS